MAGINFVCIGKLKERFWKEAQAEYVKRLGAFGKVRIIEKKEVQPGGSSAALIQKAREDEGLSLLSSCNGSVIALSPDGAPLDSMAFSSVVRKFFEAGDITFVIGGSYGLSDTVKKKAAKTISFSPMTMPHQLFRIVLLEQVYRAMMINAARTYHK